MAEVRSYCSAEDVRQRLPLFIDEQKERGSSDTLNDAALESFCLSASAEMDRRFSQYGWETPINFGEVGEETYNQLLALTLRNIALYGACALVIGATSESEEQFEVNIYQNLFDREIMKIQQKGFPTSVPRNITATEAFGVSTGKRRDKPIFSPAGINYDAK